MFDIRERHFTISELASNFKHSYDATLDIFRKEPGVLRISRPRKSIRHCTTIRVPQSVAERDYQRLTSNGQP